MSQIKEEQSLRVTIFGIVAILAIFGIVFASSYLSDTRFDYQNIQDTSVTQFESFSNEDKDLVGGASRAFTSSQTKANPPVSQNPQTIPVDQLLEQKSSASGTSQQSNALNPSQSSQVIVRGNNNEQIIVGTGQGINVQTLPQTIAQNAVVEKFDGYIVKLKDKSVAEKFQELDKKIGTAKTQNSLELKKYQAELLKKQEAEIKTLKSLIPNLKIKRKFATAFNGFHANLTQQEVQKLRNKGYKVWPNMQVKAVLMDSVPLINADKVWQLDEEGGQCFDIRDVLLEGYTKIYTIGGKDYEVTLNFVDADEAQFIINGQITKKMKKGDTDKLADGTTIGVEEIVYQDYEGGIHSAAFYLANKQCLTGKGVKIAIIDTGVDYTHEDLGGCFGQSCKVEGGYDFVECDEFDSSGNCISPRNPDQDPIDDQGHGTHVAATAAGKGVLKGVAPDSNIIAYKVLNNDGVGLWSWVIEGIERAIDPNQDGDFSDRADIISMSLGGQGDPDDPVSQAVDNAVNVGTVAVIAAGNSGPSYQTIGSPGTAREAITVGATDKSDQIASFSSRGPVIWNDKSLIKPDIVAPGVSICAAEYDNAWSDRKCLDDKHISISGTSMATPHVAGAVALLKQKNSSYSPHEIKNILLKSAKSIGTNPLLFGYGRIDILNAITGNFKTDEITTIESPGKISRPFDIVGKINGEDFKSYQIEIGYANPSIVNIKFSKIFESNTLPSNQYIARNIQPPFDYGSHIIKLTVYFSDKEPTVKYAYIFNIKGSNIELMRGWPQSPFEWQQGFWGVGSTPLVEDFDKDGKKEIITFSMDQVTIWRYDGTIMNGWPRKINGGVMSSGNIPPPSIADIDGDNIPEVVMVDYFSFFAKNGKACGYAWKMDGSNVNGWLNNCGVIQVDNVTYGTSSLFDIDNDGKKELLLYADQFKENKTFIYLVNGDSTIHKGWPILVRDKPNSFSSMPAIADLDGDGKLEIISMLNQVIQDTLSCDGVISLYDDEGNKKYSFDSECNDGMPDPLLLVDVDGDKKIDIGYATWAWDERIIFYDLNGKIISGWPIDNSPNQKNFLIATDLFNDKTPDIIVNHHKRFPYSEFVTVFDAMGKELQGWPQPTMGLNLWVRPQTADLDGDGYAEILTTTNAGLIYAWDRFGTLLNGFPIEMDGQSESGVAVEDIDNDGKLEIVAGLHDGTVYVWKLKNSVVPLKKDWPMWKHDPQNTGLYGSVTPPSMLPDLTIPQASVTKEKIGYSYKALVSNTGTKDSGQYVFQVKEQNLPARTKLLSSLKPAESRIINGRIAKLPATFTVDPKNLIKELNEDNNNLTATKIINVNLPSLRLENGP